MQFSFGSVHAPAAVKRRDSGIPESAAQRQRGIRTRRPRPALGPGVHGNDVIAVVAQGHHEVVEVVLEVGFHDAGLEGDDPNTPAVGVGIEVEIGPG